MEPKIFKALIEFSFVFSGAKLFKKFAESDKLVDFEIAKPELMFSLRDLNNTFVILS
jgi:hypothetical protein